MMSTSFVSGFRPLSAGGTLGNATLTFLNGPQAFSTPLLVQNSGTEFRSRRSFSTSCLDDDGDGHSTTLNVFHSIEGNVKYVQDLENNNAQKQPRSAHAPPSLFNEPSLENTIDIFAPMPKSKICDFNPLRRAFSVQDFEAMIVESANASVAKTPLAKHKISAPRREEYDEEIFHENNFKMFEKPSDISYTKSLTVMEEPMEVEELETTGVEDTQPRPFRITPRTTPRSRPSHQRRPSTRKTIERTWFVESGSSPLLDDIEIRDSDILALSDDNNRLRSIALPSGYVGADGVCVDLRHLPACKNDVDSAFNSPRLKKTKQNTPCQTNLPTAMNHRAAKGDVQETLWADETSPPLLSSDGDYDVDDAFGPSPLRGLLRAGTGTAQEAPDASLIDSLLRAQRERRPTPARPRPLLHSARAVGHASFGNSPSQVRDKLMDFSLRLRNSMSGSSSAKTSDSSLYLTATTDSSSRSSFEDSAAFCNVDVDVEEMNLERARSFHARKQTVYAAFEAIFAAKERMEAAEERLDAELAAAFDALKAKLARQ